VPPRCGINPFTKQPTLFHPAPGAAFFKTPAGRCSVEYRDGTLVLSSGHADAASVAVEIASAFDAEVVRIDGG
jgi:hypothetical protein